MKQGTSIAICGAGLGGMTAAIALALRGADVTVYEQAPQFGEVGAGLQLSANAVRVLASLGVLPALAERASEAEGKRVRLWNSGKSWKLFDLGVVSEERYGFPYLLLHRADLHDILAARFRELRPEAIKLGKRLSSFAEDASGVTLQFEDGSSARHDLLVGADGVHSRVRAQLIGPSPVEFSGCLAWRGIVRAADVPAHLREEVGTNWIGPRGHVIQYPLRGGELINFVGIVERDDWTDDSWSTPGTVQECLDDFEGWHEDVRSLISAIDTPMKWALNLRPPLEKWSSERVTLLGDASHPTLPFLAQGACMAIEDGVVLARALDEYDEPTAAFAAYEHARIERTTAIVNGSAANARRFHNPVLSDAVLAEEYVAQEWAPSRVAERYEWLFEYDALAAKV